MKVLLGPIGVAVLVVAIALGFFWLNGMEPNKSSVEVNTGAVKFKVEAAKPPVETPAAVQKHDQALPSTDPVKPNGVESKAATSISTGSQSPAVSQTGAGSQSTINIGK
jgi:hypothetical protein